MPSWGHFIKRAREELGLSQTDFAALLGVHNTTVSRWERTVDDPQPAEPQSANAREAIEAKIAKALADRWWRGPAASA